jgi:hypothetical protein
VNSKIIYTNIYNPNNSIFKSSKNDRAEMQQVFCSNNENCDLFKDGRCFLINALSRIRCPYGSYQREQGFTKRANGFSKWISERKEKYKDSLSKLTSASDKMAIIGDYIYFPYPYFGNYVNPLEIARKGIIPKDSFTPDFIVTVFKYRPQALFGGEITSFQKESVPLIATHLKEVFPDIFNEVVKIYPEINNLIGNYSNVGRKAKLHSLRKGVVIQKDKESWIWDGEYLVSNNLKILFSIVEYSEIECKIKPKENVVVNITSNDQVDKNTKYMD